MRIVLLTETYSKNMRGYAEAALSKALAELGAEVHLLAMDIPPYFHQSFFQETYASFNRREEASPEREVVDGYTVHRLPHRRVFGYLRMEGLFGKLKSLRPDVVQTFAPISWMPLDAALAQPLLGYALFTGCHTTASVFPLARRRAPLWDRERLRSNLTRALCGRIVSLFTERCYGATADCADVGVRFFGVPRGKMDVSPLGVDTRLFFPAADGATQRARETLRAELGFEPGEIVCIYTGRFTEDKNPLALARAVGKLAGYGRPFRGLFVGDGIQGPELESSPGCVVRAFVPHHELTPYYHAADIGVWPTQESTSMLDAAACGLPLVVNDTLVAVERIDGNGITYRLNDVEDLARALASLEDPVRRLELGRRGAERMVREFGWESLARRRLEDYSAALARRGS